MKLLCDQLHCLFQRCGPVPFSGFHKPLDSRLPSGAVGKINKAICEKEEPVPTLEWIVSLPQHSVLKHT